MPSQLFSNTDTAALYDRYVGQYHRHDAAAEAFRTLVPLETRILEIGVGTGRFTRLLLAAGYDVHGIEGAAAMLERAPSDVQDRTVHADLREFHPKQLYGAVVSHSGGFTYKRGKMESHYAGFAETLGALNLISFFLEPRGRFFINATEHDPVVTFDDGATLTTVCEENGTIRRYTYIFSKDGQQTVKHQRRRAFSLNELSMHTPYFEWTLGERWLVGEKRA